MIKALAVGVEQGKPQMRLQTLNDAISWRSYFGREDVPRGPHDRIKK